MHDEPDATASPTPEDRTRMAMEELRAVEARHGVRVVARMTPRHVEGGDMLLHCDVVVVPEQS